MANRKQRRAQSARAQRLHTQTEIARRLYRAHNLSCYLSLDLLRMPQGIQPLWLPSVLSYLADDLRDVQQMVSEKNRPA